MEVIVKGMKKLCVCMLVCVCLFGVDAINAQPNIPEQKEDGPLYNFLLNMRPLWWVLNITKSDADKLKEAEKASLNSKYDAGAGVKVNGLYDVFTKLHNSVSDDSIAVMVASQFNLNRTQIDTLKSAIASGKNLDGSEFYEINFCDTELPGDWRKVHVIVTNDNSARFYR
jgi:hypothetical protein